MKGKPKGDGGDTPVRGARLVGDLGGTHARFATVDSSGGLDRVEVLDCADYSTLQDAIHTYLDGQELVELAEVCLAVAGPVDQDPIDLPNNPWSFARLELQQELGAPLKVINDFTAQALSIDRLGPDDITWIGTPRPHDGGTRVVVGPGTGLGVAIHMSGCPVLPSEGGHAGFAPTSEHEIDLLRALRTRFRRLSMERFLSGPGLENLYWANWHIERGHPDTGFSRISAREITALAGTGDPMALRSVNDFFDILASFVGDLALTAWATGGVFLSGGILRKVVSLFDLQRFRARFEDKGRFTRFCETLPLGWITFEYPGLLGCSAALGAGKS